jgi:hypothetical protein
MIGWPNVIQNQTQVVSLLWKQDNNMYINNQALGNSWTSIPMDTTTRNLTTGYPCYTTIGLETLAGPLTSTCTLSERPTYLALI